MECSLTARHLMCMILYMTVVNNFVSVQETPDESPDALSLREFWLGRVITCPEMFGPVDVWFDETLELLAQIKAGSARDLTSMADTTLNVAARPWDDYWRKLAPTQLVARTEADGLVLTDQGARVLQQASPVTLGVYLHRRIRLFGELLSEFSTPLTIAEARVVGETSYHLGWSSAHPTRLRVSWFRALGLVEEVGRAEVDGLGTPSVQYQLSSSGREAIGQMTLVLPEVLDVTGSAPELSPAPDEIVVLEADTDQAKRVRREPKFSVLPSPRGQDTQKIETLRSILVEMRYGVSKSELDEYLVREFNYRSGTSLLTGLRAAKLILEAKRQVFQTTPAAQAWIDSGDDVNLLRILHSTLGFVGKILEQAKSDDGVETSVLYKLHDPYEADYNTIRLLINLMEDVGVIEEARYLIKRATPLGVALLAALPFYTYDALPPLVDDTNELEDDGKSLQQDLIQRLVSASRDPNFNQVQSGLGFEEVITEVFRYLGVSAHHIGGSGDTDVLVELNATRYVVDAKSKSGGMVTSGDIKETNLEEHRNKHGAVGIVIVGHQFAGDTIRSWASRKHAALIPVGLLVAAISAYDSYGLGEDDIDLLLRGEFEEFEHCVDAKRRDADMIALVTEHLVGSTLESDEASEQDMSPQEIWRESKSSALKPTREELREALELLTDPVVGLVQLIETAKDNMRSTYRLAAEPGTVSRSLRSLADAIERGASEARSSWA